MVCISHDFFVIFYEIKQTNYSFSSGSLVMISLMDLLKLLKYYHCLCVLTLTILFCLPLLLVWQFMNMLEVIRYGTKVMFYPMI